MTIFSRLVAKYLERPFSLSETNVFEKQQVLLNSILRYAKNHINFYRKLDKDKRLECLQDYPIIDKHIISSNIEDFVSNRKDYYYFQDGYTGGSTGEPFHLLLSGGFEFDFGLKRWQSYGYIEGDKILALDGTKIPELNLKKHEYLIKKSNKDIPFGSMALSSLYLCDDNAEDYCNSIIEFNPDFMRGYPSFVYSLACYFEKFGIEPELKIKGIELTSENVYPYQIKKIETVFKTNVYCQYGHTEACVCANTYDKTYRYRVEPLYGYVEVVDSEGKHVKEGCTGEIVVTTLHNKVMPLIRYRTGDFAEYGGKDERFVYLNRILGRTQDYIVDRNSNKIILTALIFAQHCAALGHICKWQLEQFKEGEVIAHIIKNGGYSSEDETEIRDLFNRVGNVDTVFDYVDTIALTKRGKSPMLVQHLNID